MPEFVWTSERVADALGLPPEGLQERSYTGISTDTRKLRAGELFVALQGENFDGADFLSAAIESGATGAVVTARAEGPPKGTPADFELFVVPDTLVALGKLANARRRVLDPVAVAITGTNGKTTTRRLLASALGPRAAESPANFNNLVGVPLSMLGASEDARWWVLELASNQPGEISRLSRIAEPSVGVITSIGEGHLQGLGDLKGVLGEKLDLIEGLDEAGHLFIADRPDDLARTARQRFPSVTTVGLDEADERPEGWSLGAEGTEWAWRDTSFRVRGFGVHLVKNGLLAAVVAAHLGVEPADAAARMAEVEMPPMRGEVRRVGGLTLLVDCYNANPASFEAALESLGMLAGGKRSVVVAGTMLELGHRSAELHARVLRRVLESNVHLLVATGEFADVALDVEPEFSDRLIVDREAEAAYARLAGRLAGEEVVLLKGSRGVRLERLIPLFERDFGGGDEGLEA